MSRTVRAKKIVDIEGIDRSIRRFVLDMNRLGIKPRVFHNRNERNILVAVSLEDIIGAFKKRVPSQHVSFKVVEKALLIEVRY